jgi:hypothetical protein
MSNKYDEVVRLESAMTLLFPGSKVIGDHHGVARVTIPAGDKAEVIVSQGLDGWVATLYRSTHPPLDVGPRRRDDLMVVVRDAVYTAEMTHRMTLASDAFFSRITN